MAFHYKIYGISSNENGADQRISGQDSIDLDIFVGASAQNSHPLVNIQVYRTVNDKGEYIFTLNMDGKTIKKVTFNPKTKEFK